MKKKNLPLKLIVLLKDFFSDFHLLNISRLPLLYFTFRTPSLIFALLQSCCNKCNNLQKQARPSLKKKQKISIFKQMTTVLVKFAYFFLYIINNFNLLLT